MAIAATVIVNVIVIATVTANNTAVDTATDIANNMVIATATATVTVPANVDVTEADSVWNVMRTVNVDVADLTLAYLSPRTTMFMLVCLSLVTVNSSCTIILLDVDYIICSV